MITQTGLVLEICFGRLKATTSAALLLVALACLSKPAYAALVMCPRHWNDFIGVAESAIEEAGDKRAARVLFYDSDHNILNCAGEDISDQELFYVGQTEYREDEMMRRALGQTEYEKIVPHDSCTNSLDKTEIGLIVLVRLPSKESEMRSERCIEMLDYLRQDLPDWISSRD